jgi:class 3 adenylate cyclase
VPIDRLLIRAPNWMGDVVLSLAAVRDLRRNFPAARIEVLARPSVVDLYRAVGEVDGIGMTGAFRDDVRTIKSGMYDAVALLTNSFGTALQARLAGVPERWGYATDGRGPLLTRRARVPPEVRGLSEVYYYRAMLAGVGLQVTASPDVTLRCPDEWAARGAALLGDGAGGGAGPWVGFSPGAAFGSAKRWMPERYAAVGDLLARHQGARIAILGGPGERPLADTVAAGMRSAARNLSGETTTAEMVGVLDRLFSRFDALVERHGLEKIKTIGDAYMAAAGVPEPVPDHARRPALLALDMREVVATSPVVDGPGLQLRIGINSGPVVAGVIGTKRFLYDLWGDAVNTASRMESHGTAGEIQITRATYELLKDEFVCGRRGTIPVKGKGDMETWYLVEQRSDARR